MAPLSPYDTNIAGVVSTELRLEIMDTLNMEVTGKEVTLFYRHNMQLKDIKTGFARSIEKSGHAEVLTLPQDTPNLNLLWVPATPSNIPENAVAISHLENGEEVFLGKHKEVKRGYGYVFHSKGLLFEKEFYEDFAILCNFNFKIN